MTTALGYRSKLYLDGYDRSSNTFDFTGDANADTVDVTTWGSSGWKSLVATMKGGTINFNMSWDPAVGGIAQQLVAALGSSMIPTININETGAAGDSAIVMPGSILEKNSPAIKPADIIRMGISIKPSGAMGLAGVTLFPSAQLASITDGTSIDNAVSSANGGRGNIHFTEITGGAARVLIKHSTDNSSFSTLIDSGSQTVIGATSTEVSGTVNRYLRITLSAVATSATFYVAFARY